MTYCKGGLWRALAGKCLEDVCGVRASRSLFATSVEDL